MSDTASSEQLQAFLNQHPDIELFEVSVVTHPLQDEARIHLTT